MCLVAYLMREMYKMVTCECSFLLGKFNMAHYGYRMGDAENIQGVI